VAGNPKAYSVGSAAGKQGYASTLAEAKVLGAKIAKQEAWKGKWKVLYLIIAIHTLCKFPERRHTDLGFYRPTGWVMFVPVRGTGKSATYIVDAIKRQKGVAPFRWVKR